MLPPTPSAFILHASFVFPIKSDKEVFAVMEPANTRNHNINTPSKTQH